MFDRSLLSLASELWMNFLNLGTEYRPHNFLMFSD